MITAINKRCCHCLRIHEMASFPCNLSFAPTFGHQVMTNNNGLFVENTSLKIKIIIM